MSEEINYRDITPAPTISYREHWTVADALRELYQNALDECDAAGLPYDTFKIEYTKDGLLISDEGRGLTVRNLFLGEGKKERWQRGAFGEGLKIAALVLLRSGYPIVIRSGDMEVEPFWKEEKVDDEVVKVLAFRKKTIPPVRGTKILVKGYFGPSYKENISLFDKKVLAKRLHVIDGKEVEDRLIDEKPGRLYVRNLFVEELKPEAEFSYDLWDVRLEESRRVASRWDVELGAGELWAQVRNKELIKRFFKAVEENKFESEVRIYSIPITSADAWQQAFKEYFGKFAVLWTDESMAAQAEWIGRKPVKLPDNISIGLRHVVETDVDAYLAHIQSSEALVDPKKLAAYEAKVWRGLCDLFERLKAKYPQLANWRLEIMTKTKDGGVAIHSIKSIRINRDILSDPIKSLAVFIEEVAHAVSGAADMTKLLYLAVSDVGATISSIVMNEYWRKKFGLEVRL
jgi:hypothetical protein